MVALEKMGTHLKYFSQKQDVVLIKNLLSSIQHRWEKIVSRSAERTRHLERGYKEAKQVHSGTNTGCLNIYTNMTYLLFLLRIDC